MGHFEKIASGIDVGPLLAQIEAQPELWCVHPERTHADESPFAGTSDIWVRFRDKRELTEPKHYGEMHYPVFYPAWDKLPALRPIVFHVMSLVRATHLGGILITKIPAGGWIKPHNDRGSWHAEFYGTKVYVGVKSNPHCVNYCEDEASVITAGDVVTFNNLLTHSVENNGFTDRITAIICMTKS